MALILGRVCSIRAFQTLLASSTAGGSSVLALLAAGCSRTSSQSTHGSHDRCEAFREQHNRGIVSFSLPGCSSSGSIARLRSTDAAGAAQAGASSYAMASTAAGTFEADEAAASSDERSRPLWKRPVNGLPAPAPGPKGARIASRKPALKKPSRHQWFYCDVDYDPLQQPDGFRPLPPYAPEWARAKNYQQIYYKERPKHHRNKYHRGWLKNMDLADQRWKEAWQAKLAKQARWDATVKRKQDSLKRQVAWRAWQTWTRSQGQAQQAVTSASVDTAVASSAAAAGAGAGAAAAPQ